MIGNIDTSHWNQDYSIELKTINSQINF
jgi:hypothetical protein